MNMSVSSLNNNNNNNNKHFAFRNFYLHYAFQN